MMLGSDPYIVAARGDQHDQSHRRSAGSVDVDRENGDVFQIIGVDEGDRSIEIQYVDGSLEESSLEDWTQRRLEACEQPEDWVGPFDDVESEDVGLPESPPALHSSDAPMERALLAIEEGRSLPVGDTED